MVTVQQRPRRYGNREGGEIMADGQAETDLTVA